MSHKDHLDEAKRPAPTPVADRIRARIEASGERFHANDNIARHIEHGELDALQAEVEARMEEVLRLAVGLRLGHIVVRPVLESAVLGIAVEHHVAADGREFRPKFEQEDRRLGPAVDDDLALLA